MDEIQRIVIEELRQVEGFEGIAPEAPETLDIALLGKGSKLDSTGLVTLIFAIEDRIQNELGVSIEISSERAMSQSRSPFRTVGSLIVFASELVSEVR